MSSNIYIVPVVDGYMMFTTDIPKELANLTFQNRFGHAADVCEIDEKSGFLKVGPVQEES